MTINRPLQIDACHCFTTRKAARLTTRFYDDMLQSTGLRITQYLTLALLQEIGTSFVNDLAELLDLERTAMGKNLTVLERLDLISTRPSATDGRYREVSLTAKGMAAFRAAHPVWEEAQRQLEALNGENSSRELRSRLASLELPNPAPATE